MQVDAYWYPGSGSELQGTVPVRGRETSKGERDRKRYEGIGRGTEEEYNGLEVE